MPHVVDIPRYVAIDQRTGWLYDTDSLEKRKRSPCEFLTEANKIEDTANYGNQYEYTEEVFTNQDHGFLVYTIKYWFGLPTVDNKHSISITDFIKYSCKNPVYVVSRSTFSELNLQTINAHGYSQGEWCNSPGAVSYNDTEVIARTVSLMPNEANDTSPYLVQVLTERATSLLHNPNFDQTTICNCGHEYSEHFDTSKNLDDYGNLCTIPCNYCSCDAWECPTLMSRL